MDEKYISYFIRKIEELEKRVAKLEGKPHKTLKEAVKEHDMLVQKSVSDNVIKEKRVLGKIVWGRKTDKKEDKNNG